MQRLKLKRLCSLILVSLLFFDVLPALALTGEQVAKLVANDGAADDFFGYSVAMSGGTAVIGAYGNEDLRAGSGSAYVFVDPGKGWRQQAKLTADDGALGDQFGYSVAVSGITAVIGAYGDNDQGTQSGSAYVFVYNGSSWVQQAKLLADDGAAGDKFGFAVAVSGDTAVIGAPLDDDMGENAGSAYVFVDQGNGWVQQAKLTADDGELGDTFGVSVAVSGITAVIGASADADQGDFSGSAYVFSRIGTSWSQEAKLLASDGAFGDNFGRAVAVSGSTALIGARGDDDLGSDAGSAYVFSRAGISWTQQAKLFADDGAAGDNFGFSVAVSGGTAVIGAFGNGSRPSDSGSAYVFAVDGAIWAQQSKLTANDRAADDQFGSVAMSGGTAVIGARMDDDLGDQSGSAYIFSVERFNDVPPNYWSFSFIERLAASGISAGCGNNNYCPTDPVTRAQMAVFLERGTNGSAYIPPAATGNLFLDVKAGDFAANFIEKLFLDGITAGCGNNNYCPDGQVTRAQMAVFLLRAKYGSGFTPPPATGIFSDAPLGSFAVGWIEQLAAEGITSGCGGGNYCPDNSVTRAEMAVFLIRTFSVPTILMSGDVLLNSGTGYDFSTGTAGDVTNGDFYLPSQAGLSKFYANNSGMQGLVDVGVTVGSLQDIPIPSTGYYMYGVLAIVGHSYVSRAAISEPDNFILFRVTGVSASAVTLDWVYVYR